MRVDRSRLLWTIYLVGVIFIGVVSTPYYYVNRYEDSYGNHIVISESRDFVLGEQVPNKYSVDKELIVVRLLIWSLVVVSIFFITKQRKHNEISNSTIGNNHI